MRNFLVFVCMLASCSVSLADTIVLEAIDSGFINSLGRTSKNDGLLPPSAPAATFNYSAGAIDETPTLGSEIDVPRKNFFTFDLSGIAPGSVTSAGLLLFNPIDGYSSPDLSETYVVGGTTTDLLGMSSLADDLTEVYDITVASELATAVTLYSLLGDTLAGGPAFGSADITESDEGIDIELAFGTDGVSYVNTFAGGKVVFGGEVTTLDATDSGDEVVFGFTAPLYPGFFAPDPDPPIPPGLITPTPKLVLITVPEPNGACLTVFGLLGLMRIRKRPTE